MVHGCDVGWDDHGFAKIAWIAPIRRLCAGSERAPGRDRRAPGAMCEEEQPPEKPWAPALSDRRPLSPSTLPDDPEALYSTIFLGVSFITIVFARVVKWATTFCWFGCDDAVFDGSACQSPLVQITMSPVE